MEKTKTFPEGVFFKKPREGSPDFVRGSLSFKVDQAIEFLQKHKNEGGYVNIDMLLSKKNEIYLALNEWKPNKGQNASPDAPQPLTEAEKHQLDIIRKSEVKANEELWRLYKTQPQIDIIKKSAQEHQKEVGEITEKDFSTF